VLVSTSIIESGLDIPTANTLVVDRADWFGLAQLYQLRGRVGRSSQQAYAYFFHPPTGRLTDEARARMETLAPGFTASILGRQVIGPHEMETRFGLVGGNIFHGELSANQLFHMRPAPGYADFTTPIAGLYQASSATHGGGGVTGIPALQVVKRVLKSR
jgi:phytoene dehydrogenase-like protein